MIEKRKATVRAKLEHRLDCVKHRFGHQQHPYWCLAKNTAPLFPLLALANRMIAKRRWCALDAQGA